MKRQVILVRRSDLALVRRSDAPEGLVKGNLIKGLMLTSLHSDHIAVGAAAAVAAAAVTSASSSSTSSSPSTAASAATAAAIPAATSLASTHYQANPSNAINNIAEYPPHLSPTSSISSASTVDQQEIRNTISPSLENLVTDTTTTLEPEPLLVVDHHSRSINNVTRQTNNHQSTTANIINTKSSSNNASINGPLTFKTTIAHRATHDRINNKNLVSATNHETNSTYNIINKSALINSHRPISTTTATNASVPSASQAKRPRLTNSRVSLTPWKALQYHFQRHADVKQRPDKKLTMSELSHEGLQRRNGWKVHHLVGQLDDLIDNEFQMRDRLKSLLGSFHSDTSAIVHRLAERCKQDLHNQRSYGRNEFDPALIVTRLDDLLKGNLQRSSAIIDQFKDSKSLIIRITDEHKDRVASITSRSLSRRSYVHNVRERQAS